MRFYTSSRLSTIDALVPPNPNEFDSTQPSFTLSCRSRTIGMSALARRRHHVVAVGSGAITGHLGVDFRAARLGVLKLLENKNTGAAGDDEAVAVAVVGARRLVRRLIEARRHRAHGVEQHRHGPV